MNFISFLSSYEKECHFQVLYINLSVHKENNFIFNYIPKLKFSLYFLVLFYWVKKDTRTYDQLVSNPKKIVCQDLINVNVACDIKFSFKMSNTPPPTEVENDSILIEAEGEWAILDTGLTIEDKLTYALESLRKSFDCKLNTLIQTQKASDQNFDDKINTLNQHLVDLKKDIQEENKQKTLERALALTDLESFQYYEDPGTLKYSVNLAKDVIKWFMLDHGYFLPKASLARTQRIATDEETNEFRDKFKAQIKVLIKREPRLVKNPNGGFGIHYS